MATTLTLNNDKKVVDGDDASSSDSSSSDSSDSDSDSSSDEEDHQVDGFTKEQREAINKRLAALRGNFKKAEESSIDQKVEELMNSVQSLQKDEALLALQVCNNNEFEAAERLETEPGFHESISNMVLGSKPKIKKKRVARPTSMRNAVTQVQVNGEGGAVVRRNNTGKGANIPMNHAVVFFDVPDDVTDEGIRTFCSKFGKINHLEFQRVRLRAVCSFVTQAAADKLAKEYTSGTAVIDGFTLRLKKKVKKNNRVGRVLVRRRKRR